MIEMKRCRKCGKEKPREDFYIRRGSPDGLQPRCKDCARVSSRECQARYNQREDVKKRNKEYRHSNPERMMLHAARKRAKKDCIPCTITLKDIVIPEFCPIFGIPLIPGNGSRGPSQDAPSLDRIIPELGYIPGNVQVISIKANTMKGNATAKELMAFAEWVMTNVQA